MCVCEKADAPLEVEQGVGGGGCVVVCWFCWGGRSFVVLFLWKKLRRIDLVG